MYRAFLRSSVRDCTPGAQPRLLATYLALEANSCLHNLSHPHLEVVAWLTAFRCSQDASHKYYEIVLVDPHHNAIRNVRTGLLGMLRY